MMEDKLKLESLDPSLALKFPKIEEEVQSRVQRKGLSLKYSQALWIKIPR